MTMMKKNLFAACALLALCGCAARSPEEELRMTRERLERYLFSEEALTQTEMTILSEYLLHLTYMERNMIEYRICNRPGYGEIEKRFLADRARRNRELEEEYRRPSDYAGGSMEPADRNLRMTALEQKHIRELKEKWLAEQQ